MHSRLAEVNGRLTRVHSRLTGVHSRLTRTSYQSTTVSGGHLEVGVKKIARTGEKTTTTTTILFCQFFFQVYEPSRMVHKQVKK